MKKLASTLILALSISTMCAQQPVPKPEPKVAPIVPVVIARDLWKAQAELLSAQATVDRANAALAKANQAWQTICGASWLPKQDDDGEPACVAKPEPSKPETQAKP